MTKKKRMVDGKYTCFTLPQSIIDYFEEKAQEELEDGGSEVNVVSLGRMRNDMIVAALEVAIKVYTEEG